MSSSDIGMAFFDRHERARSFGKARRIRSSLALTVESRYTYFHMASAALDVRSFSRLFKALGDETRLRIVALLSHGELCVCHLEDALQISQPKVSRHLALLRSAGVVDHRREGSWVYYRLAVQSDPDCEHQLNTLMRTFAKRSVLRRDLERLVKVRGPESCK